ncbi:hypothetical protein [Gemmata sp.]|uniref:hypothetical protein n=1 Tax=Gemmata sp. TaxID=1914242 RepID=UPI003F71374F
MTTRSFRPLAALALAAGLCLALPACNKKKPGTDRAEQKDKKDGTTPNPVANTNPAPEVKAPERVDTKAGVGKDAVDFLTAVGAGTAKAGQLSSGFVKLVGLPVEFESDKAKGFSGDAAEAWLRRVGSKLTGMGPMSESSQAGDVAVFRGNFTGGAYFLRMVREGGAWRADWLSLSSVPATGPAAAGGADPLLQAFAATAVAAAMCDRDALSPEQRTATVAAGLTPALRASLAPPFDGDKAHGFDHSPAQLGLKLSAIGGGAEAVSVTPAGDGFKVEVTKAGGAKAAYLLKLAKGPTAGQWLVESITPQ